MARLIVLENPKNWNLEVPGAEIVAARDYLADPRHSERKRTKVYNLCRTYGYQTTGYYVSLLAEARGHKPLPSVSTLQDLRLSPVLRVASEELEELIAKALGEGGDRRGFNLYFGRSPDAAMDRLAQALFKHFPSPLLHAEFTFAGKWRLDSVRPVGTAEIPQEDRPFAAEQAARHFRRAGGAPVSPITPSRYDMAILYDPAEVDSPSDEDAIRKFVRAAETVGIEATVIGRDDFGRLGEFDALFLRETTSVNHHTYRFARRAEAEGLVVIDSPRSIVRCGNKVYQAEVFARHGIACPRTVIFSSEDAKRVGEQLGYPVVLKRPDSAFSLGVVKAKDPAELEKHVRELFGAQELGVAQEFVPSGFDWRVGVLDGKCLWVCKYHMAKGHWQIRGGRSVEKPRFGRVEAVAPGDAPAGAVELGVRAASLMGNDLYGVDVKEVDGRYLVMEVNDNPSLEAGDEDAVLKDELYLTIMRAFLERLEARGVKET
jgi:glutathione synthase/RimK-type ligase-like ATP-grasp enzyme